MIIIKNVRNLFGDFETVNLHSGTEETIDAKGEWVLLPALIDVGSFPVADWGKEAAKAVSGGSTFVLDLFSPPKVFTKEVIDAHKLEVNEQLRKAKIPLRNKTYVEISPKTIEELGKVKHELAAIELPKKFQGDKTFVDRVFQLAAQEECLVLFSVDANGFHETKTAVSYAEKYATQLVLLNISTQEELQLLRDAHKGELLVDGTVAPLTLLERTFLWEALRNGTISCVASSTSEDRACLLSVLLDGYHHSHIALEEIIEFTRIKPERLLQLPLNGDAVVADLTLPVDAGKGRILKGGARFTILGGATYPVNWPSKVV